jgi:hypothetical protein
MGMMQNDASRRAIANLVVEYNAYETICIYDALEDLDLAAIKTAALLFSNQDTAVRIWSIQ